MYIVDLLSFSSQYPHPEGMQSQAPNNYRAGSPKNFPKRVHSHPRSSSGSIFAIRPAKWGFSGLLSRFQQLSCCNSQRWRDDGAFCVDVPSKCDGGQPSIKGAFYEFQLGEGRRGTTPHCTRSTGPIVANRAALERARRGGSGIPWNPRVPARFWPPLLSRKKREKIDDPRVIFHTKPHFVKFLAGSAL